MTSSPQSLLVFEVYKTKLIQALRISLDFARCPSVSRSLVSVLFCGMSNSLFCFNSSSEYCILGFANTKKKTNSKTKFSLKLIQNENHFFEKKVHRVFHLCNFDLGIIFGDQFSGYDLVFYRLHRGMGGHLGLQENFQNKCLVDLGTKLSGLQFQEKLLDFHVFRARWMALLFERGVKLLCLKKNR